MDIPAKFVSNSFIKVIRYSYYNWCFFPKNTTYCQYKYELSKSAMKYTPKHVYFPHLKKKNIGKMKCQKKQGLQ